MAKNSKIAKWKAQANKFMAKRKFDKAVALFLKVLEENPHDTTTRQRVADCYERLGEKEKAIAALIEIARIFEEDGRITPAIATLRRAQRLDPNNIEVIEALVSVLINQNNQIEARSLLLQLADIYERLNRYTKVLEALNRYIELMPDDYKMQRRRAHVKAELGRREEAQQEYLLLTRKLIEEKNLKEAIITAEQGVKTFPHFQELQTLLAEAYAREGQYEKAIETFEYTSPTTPEAYVLYIRSLLATGRYERARDLGKEMISLFPDAVQHVDPLIESIDEERWPLFESFFQVLIEKGFKQGKFSSAWNVLTKLIDSFPVSPDFIKGTVQYLKNQGQETKIIDLLDRLLAKKLQEGDLEKAVEYVDMIIEIDPSNQQYIEKREYLLKKIGGEQTLPPQPEVTEETQPEEEELHELFGEETLASGKEQPEEVPEDTIVRGPTPAEMPTPQAPLVEMDEFEEEEISEKIREHLTEAEVFYKFGMVQKAIEELESALRQYPGHPELEDVFDKLYQIYLNESLPDRAADKLVQRIEFYEQLGQYNKIPDVIEELRSLRPGHPRLKDFEKYAESAVEELPGVLEISSEIEGIETILQEEDENFNMMLQEAFFYVNNDLYDDARRLLEELKKKKPEHFKVKELEQMLSAPTSSGQVVSEGMEQFEDITDDSESFEIEFDLNEEADQMPMKEVKEEDVLEEEFVLPLDEFGFEDVEEETTERNSHIEPAKEVMEEEIHIEEEMTLGEDFEPVDFSDIEEFAPGKEKNVETSQEEEKPQLESEAKVVHPAEKEEISDEKEPEENILPQEEEQVKEKKVVVSRPKTIPTINVEDFFNEIFKESKKKHKKSKQLKEGAEEEIMLSMLQELKESTKKKRKSTKPGKKEVQKEEQKETESDEFLKGMEDLVEEAFGEGEKGGEQEKIEISVEQPATVMEEEEAEILEPASDTDEFEAQFIDLASEYEQEILGESQSETVVETSSEEALYASLSKFKQKIAEVVPDDDARTHFDLGLAYVQMGLLDEAIVEFQKSARNDSFYVDSQLQIADCFLQKGMPDAAIKSFSKILERKDLQPDVKKEVQYHLATLYEEMGEFEKAYEIYLDVLSSDATFKDVSEKVAQLEELRRQKPH